MLQVVCMVCSVACCEWDGMPYVGAEPVQLGFTCVMLLVVLVDCRLGSLQLCFQVHNLALLEFQSGLACFPELLH